METKKSPRIQLETERLASGGTATQAEGTDGEGSVTTRVASCWIFPELSVLVLRTLCP